MVMMKVPTAGNLMHVDKLHDYLREHRMRSLIPREHNNYGESFQDFPGLFQSGLVFPLRFLVSEVSHTSVYLLRVSIVASLYYSCILIIALELGLIQSRKSAVKSAAIILATSCGAMPAALANCNAIEVA